MAGELERFASGCGAGATVGGTLGAGVGSVIPVAGTAAGGALGGILGCLGAGAVAAWSGQTQPLAPIGRAVTAQVPVTPSGVQMQAGTGATSAPPIDVGASGAVPAPKSAIPWLLGAVLAVAVVLFAVSRRRR